MVAFEVVKLTPLKFTLAPVGVFFVGALFGWSELQLPNNSGAQMEAESMRAVFTVLDQFELGEVLSIDKPNGEIVLIQHHNIINLVCADGSYGLGR